MLTGSCLCGSVAYEADADPGSIVHCHCRTCRKTHGSAFSTVTNVPRDRFRWVRGEDLLRGFESSPGKTRYFCTQCGSHIVAARDGKDTIPLRMGCLDTPIAERPKVHTWRSEGASWFDPKNPLPGWPEGTPPKGRPVRPHPEEPRSGVSKDEWHQRGRMVRDGATHLLTMRV